jgi:hypothetical protein
MALLLWLLRRSRTKRREDQPKYIDAERDFIAYIYYFLSISSVIYLASRQAVARAVSGVHGSAEFSGKFRSGF